MQMPQGNSTRAHRGNTNDLLFFFRFCLPTLYDLHSYIRADGPVQQGEILNPRQTKNLKHMKEKSYQNRRRLRFGNPTLTLQHVNCDCDTKDHPKPSGGIGQGIIEQEVPNA